MNKKQLARMEMLRKLSKDKSGEVHSEVGEKLKAKKLQKVTVIAPNKKSLEKGLSKAQQILKAKLGKELLDEHDEDESEESEHDCPVCEDEGCDECAEELA